MGGSMRCRRGDPKGRPSRLPRIPAVVPALVALAWLLAGGAYVNADDGAPDAACGGPTLSVDDKAIQDRLTTELTTLQADGKTAAVATLIEQLARTRHELELPDAPSEARTPAELYEALRSGVVLIGSLFKCEKCQNWHLAVATGFVLTSSGAVATNHHVVNDAKHPAMGAMTSDGKVHVVTEVLAADAAEDVAVLQLDGEGFTPIPLGGTAPVGTPVTVIGHPHNHFWSLTAGHVSRYAVAVREKRRVTRLIITADYAQGSSGSPILDDRGAVIGIAASTHSVHAGGHGDEKTSNLQMVVKECVGVEALRRLVAPE